MSIPDLAADMLEKTLNEVSQVNSGTIFFVGNKSVGKSTLIHTFLDKSETPKETLVLEYSFGRKTMQKQGLDKSVCHVWEYGGNLDMLKSVLTSVPVTGNYTLCIMIDLSKIKLIWNTLETIIQAYQEAFSDRTQTMPQLTIIGGKYDIFKNYDSVIKKTICISLRSVTLAYKCNLFFYSSKDSTLVRRAKEIMHNIGFGTGFPVKEKVISINKPLYIAKDSDSWESIGVAPSTLEQIKARHFSMVPLETDDRHPVKSGTNGANLAYTDVVIDSIARVKYDELRNITSFDRSIDNVYNGIQQ